MENLYLSKLVEGRIDEAEAETVLQKGSTGDGIGEEEPPQRVVPLQQLADDVTAVAEFLSESGPPIPTDWSAVVQIVRYGFGDAS
jgi:hypothetical protein